MSQFKGTQLLFRSDDGYTTMKLTLDHEGRLGLDVIDRTDGESCWFEFNTETLVEFENAVYAEVCRRDEGLQRVKELTGLEFYAF